MLRKPSFMSSDHLRRFQLKSVFSGSQAELLAKDTAEDRYVGSLVGVRYAEAFKSRSPLLVADPEAFAPSRFG